MTNQELIDPASKVAGVFTPSRDCAAGSVGAALMTSSGHLYTGICIEPQCGIGFCAEHSAVAEMLKAHESEISLVVAVTSDGMVVPPCGRCRELMWQVSPKNAATMVIVARGQVVPLRDLLPFPYPQPPETD